MGVLNVKRTSDGEVLLPELAEPVVKDVDLFVEATAVGTSEQIVIDDYRTLTIEIVATSSSHTLTFKGCGVSDVLKTIAGVNLATLVAGSSTTGQNELWSFDVTGLKLFAIAMTGISSGNVTVRGKLVK